MRKLSEKAKKEMLEDGLNPRIRKSFEEADRKHMEWLSKHPERNSLDRHITFLNSAQQIFGPVKHHRKVHNDKGNRL